MLLETRDVDVHYGAVRALSGVSIAVDEREIRALIGPNGAGKSTLMDVLSGRRRPSRGRVSFGGEDVTASGARRLARKGVGRSFQTTSIFPALTVRAQLELAARRHGGSARVEELSAALDLTGLLDQEADLISYGDQRRVDVALALACRPRLLLLDEPTAGLSSGDSMALAAHIKSLARDWDLTVVLVEHDLDVVFELATTITVLHLGEVLAEGSPDAIRSDERVRRAYLGVQSVTEAR